MAIQYLSDHSDVDGLYEMALKEKSVDLQYYLLESLVEMDENKAKDAAIHFLKTADRVPMIYAAINAVSKVDVDEAVQQLSHFENQSADAMYALRASVLAKKGSGLSLDYFKTEQAARINENYLEELINAMARFLSAAPVTTQDEGLSLLNSNFYIAEGNADYRLYYMITALVNQYNEESNESFKDKLRDSIRSLYAKVKDDYLKGVIKEGLGDMVD